MLNIHNYIHLLYTFGEQASINGKERPRVKRQAKLEHYFIN